MWGYLIDLDVGAFIFMISRGVWRSSIFLHKSYFIVAYSSNYMCIIFDFYGFFFFLIFNFFLFLWIVKTTFAFWQTHIHTISFVNLQMGNLNICSFEMDGAYSVMQLETASYLMTTWIDAMMMHWITCVALIQPLEISQTRV